MNTKRRKIFTVTLSFAFALIFFGCAVNKKPAETVCIPASYDLRDVDGKSYITPVKSQCVSGEWWNNVGLCWAFSSLASFESSLLKQGIAEDATAPEANLSPWYLGCYVGYNHPNYEFNEYTVGSPQVPVSYALDKTLKLGWGGSVLYTIDYLSSGKGLVLQHQAPLPLENMKKRKTLIPPDKNLSGQYMLRSGLIYMRESYDSDGEFRNAVKRAVMKHGAMATPMYLGAPDFPGQAGKSYWRDENFIDYYCDSPALVNNLVHMVTVAGWDDFRDIKGAPAKGAWLIKDSMGADFHDKGYIWISYYDSVFLKGFSYGVILKADNGEGYRRKRYQTHNGALSPPVTGSSFYESGGFNSSGLDSWGCARFKAEEDGYLKAVGLVVVNKNQPVTINIYENWDEMEQAPSGLLLSDKFAADDMGYYVIDLTEKLPIKRGKEFVIAAGFSALEDADAEPLVYVINENNPPPRGKTYQASFSAEKGWSKWTDYSDIVGDAVFYIQGIIGDE